MLEAEENGHCLLICIESIDVCAICEGRPCVDREAHDALLSDAEEGPHEVACGSAAHDKACIKGASQAAVVVRVKVSAARGKASCVNKAFPRGAIEGRT